jgi:hypothetical protein
MSRRIKGAWQFPEIDRHQITRKKEVAAAVEIQRGTAKSKAARRRMGANAAEN